ncbi:flavodoxin [Levilactobacillus acidifarinae]|nr:flavodoxin [Levilactobacillus acidifarinae]GEO68200.1 hypothetical protein LAC03_01100 [Levilactobacillus acidifarinae]
MTEPKQLIVYFTASGTTARAARALQQATGADLIEIQPQEAYPQAYSELTKRGQREMDQQIRPAMNLEAFSNFKDYSTIFVGYPTWWGQPPMIIHTLFDGLDFTGKTVVPFMTSMSSSIDEAMPTFKELLRPYSATKLVDGFRYQGSAAQVTQFLQAHKLV